MLQGLQKLKPAQIILPVLPNLTPMITSARPMSLLLKVNVAFPSYSRQSVTISKVRGGISTNSKRLILYPTHRLPSPSYRGPFPQYTQSRSEMVPLLTTQGHQEALIKQEEHYSPNKMTSHSTQRISCVRSSVQRLPSKYPLSVGNSTALDYSRQSGHIREAERGNTYQLVWLMLSPTRTHYGSPRASCNHTSMTIAYHAETMDSAAA